MVGHRVATVLTTTVTAVVATAVLAGCGGSAGGGAEEAAPRAFASQPGMTMARTAFADSRGAKALRIRGVVTEGGDRLTLDVRTDARGNCAGTMSEGKGTARLVVTRQAAYIKGDDAFWKDAAGNDAAALVRTLDGRWLKSKPDRRISGLCSLGSGMVARMTRALPPEGGKVRVGKHSVIDGARVVELTDFSGTASGTLYVSLEAPHYIRRVSIDDPDLKGTLTLSGFGNRALVRIPGPAESYSAG